MNPVLAYAISRRADARAILHSRGIPVDDLDDICQDVLFRIYRAAPSGTGNMKAYWNITLNTVAANYWERCAKRDPTRSGFHWGRIYDVDIADDRQDPELIAICRETVREAWRVAMPCERRAIIQVLTAPMPVPNWAYVALYRLRRRLRERAVA